MHSIDPNKKQPFLQITGNPLGSRPSHLYNGHTDSRVSSFMPSTAQSFEIFPWNSNLETGIALIDEQHARLVELLNRLAQQHVQGASAEEIQGILGELADYADYHFHSEEAIWQASLGDDPWFNQHQHSHAAFFQRIQALQDSARPFTEVLSELFAFLTQWLAFHILDSDKRMAKAVFAVADGLDVAAARQRADEEMSGATALLISTVLQMYEQLSSQALELMQEKHARERAEAALRHSESRWKFLLEGSSEGLWEWSAEHGDLFAQLGQLTLPEANDSPSWQLYEEDRQTLQRALGELYSGQQEQLLCHYRLRNAQGASRWMQLRGKVIQRDEQGQVLRLIGTRQDVSERELARQVLQLGHELLFITDHQNRITAINQAFTRVTGYSAEQVLGQSPRLLASDRHDQAFFQAFWQALQQQGRWQGEIWNQRADGSQYALQLAIHRQMGPDGKHCQYVAIGHDITALKQQQDALEVQRQHLATALEAAEAGTWEWNLQSHQVRYSPRWAQMLGYQLEELGPPTLAVWENRVHPEDLPQVMENLQEHLAGQRDSYSAEYRIQHRNGLWLWRRSLGRIMQRDEQQQPLLVVGIDIDITEHKEHQQQLSYVERHDALTGLANRVLFGEMLNHCMQQALQDNSTLAVAYIDLDDFAQLNQQLGRDACDQWLQEVVRRLQGSLREPQYLARTGGDEFAIVLCNLQAPDSYLTPLLRVLESINQPWQQGERQFSCTASIGVTRYPQDSPVDAEQLLRQADQAMYQAKLIGKNRCHLFDAAHDEHTRVQYIRLEEIRQALDNQELRLYFQPKVNMRSGQVKAFEALIRWQHPERGLLPPALFIPALSNQPLALRVGNWVIDQALQQLAQWQALGIDTCVSVNVDSYQLHSDDFAEQLLQRLQQYPQLRPQQLRLEILETGALQDMQHVSQLVDQLQAQGIEFALDDFGTGFSSLTFLKQLRAKTLKIDQSFVRQALEDPEQAMIIDSIVGLARSFEREVIAEGVESEAHGLLMLQLGCELGQGYAIARPMPAQAVAAWLASWQPPASWQASQALDEQGVQLLLAELAHVALLRQLQEYLSGQQSDAPQAHANSCRFGRWLDKPETRQRYAGREDFQALLKQHVALHELAVQLLRRHKEDARQDISQALANLLATSASLMRKLHQLRQSLHASDD